MSIFGVFTYIFDSGKLSLKFAIKISIFINIDSTTAGIFEILIDINDMKIVIKPNIMIIPKIGPANIFDIKKVNDIVL